MATVKIATIDWCPFICPESGENPGILVEYTQAIFANLEQEIHFEVYPWSRAIKMTNEGKVHALLAPAKNEAPHLLYPQHEIGLQRFCFFSRADDPWFYENVDSLTGRSIILPIDAQPPQIKEAAHNAVVVTYPYNDAYMPKATEILLRTRVDSFMMTYHSVRHFLNQRNLNSKIKTTGCVHEQKLYLAFSPASSLQEKIRPLMDHFESNISILKQQQYFKKLLTKYNMN